MLRALRFTPLALLCSGEVLLPNDPRVRYIGRFEVAPAYSLSETAGNECPTGYSKINSQAECHDAMSVAIPFDAFGWQGQEHDKNWPSGCYFCENVDGCTDGTWFNTHATGKAHGNAKPICQGGTSDGTRFFAWAGAQVVARFSGASVAANLTGSKTRDRFMAVIDGHPQTPFDTKARNKGWNQYTLAEGLDAGEHTVELWKITEDLTQKSLEGAARFGGLATEGSFVAPPAPRTRRLEFIGDSDTAGYCADGSPTGGSDKEQKTQNTYKTWAAQLSRGLGADFVAEAISGFGVRESTGSVPDLLGNSCPFQSTAASAWDFSAYVPDAVVMLIGPNDEGKSSQAFRDAYLKMMKKIAANYASAPVPPKLIHVIAGSMNGFDPADDIKTVNDEFNKGRSDGFQGFYTAITKATWKTINNHNKYKGCDDHYSEEGHATVVSEIIPQVKQIMGWDVELVIV